MTIQLQARQCITNAPEDYDYGWAKTLIDNLYIDDRRKSYRLVEVEDDWHFEQQVMRYASGLNITITTQESLNDHLKLGWLKLQAKPIVVYRKSFECKQYLDWNRDKIDAFLGMVEEVENTPGVKLKFSPSGFRYDLEIRGDENLFNEIVVKFESYLGTKS